LLCEVDMDTGRIDRPRQIDRPRGTGCESLPRWLKELAVEHVVAGGIGGSARQRLSEIGIGIWAGYRGADAPEVLLEALARRGDADGENPCADHAGHAHHHCRED